MREKTEKSKLAEGRGLLPDGSYKAWNRTNESKSIGVGAMFYDPTSGFSIDTLSQGEKEIFWILRFNKKVKDIYTQLPLQKEGVAEACRKLGLGVTGSVLSTDLFVSFFDGSFLAVSVKSNRDCLSSVDDPKTFSDKKRAEKKERAIRRQAIEKKYWELKGIPFRIVFREDIPKFLAMNIRICFSMWREEDVYDDESLLKYLIAHHIVEIKQISACVLPFRKIAETYNVRSMYEDNKNTGATFFIDLRDPDHWR